MKIHIISFKETTVDKNVLVALIAGQIFSRSGTDSEGALSNSVAVARKIVDRAFEAAPSVSKAAPAAPVAVKAATAVSKQPPAPADNATPLFAALEQEINATPLFAALEQEIKAVENDLDEAPKKRGRPKKETTDTQPVPVKKEPTAFVYQYNGFCCDKCSSDKLKIMLVNDSTEAMAHCDDCGHDESFEISAPDRALVASKGQLVVATSSAVSKEAPQAKKAAPVAEAEAPKPVAGQKVTTEWIDPKTKKRMLVSSWVDETGEQFKTITEAPPDLPTGAWSDGRPATAKSTKSQTPSSADVTPSTTASTVTKSTECPSEPQPCSKNPAAEKVAKSVLEYTAPPVDLAQARTELRELINGWPRERLIEKYEKLTTEIWDDAKTAGQIEKLIDGMLGVFG